ncbi:fibrocystin-L-like [Scylla paramamosain]|uniref:fibrocystin-L-like n=1 Tax=Scylla paramamosain TaxID=85552 RepID=UPI003083ED71
MTLGGKKCVVISGGPTEVTCTVPAGQLCIIRKKAHVAFHLLRHIIYIDCKHDWSRGTNFGTSGSVHIGSELCYTTHWSNISVSCLTPALSAGTHTLVLSADGFGAAAREVEYVLQVTSASATQGSVKGGTLVRLGGTGFSSDCSCLKVKLGQVYECEVLQCSDEALTCITRPITTNHRIVNVGTSSETVSWYPRVLEVVEGDSVTWQWSKVSENSQLQYRVCEVASPVDNCEDADDSGFFSGTQTVAGSFTVAFPQQGIHYYAGPTLPGGVVMRGQVNVVRPPHQALRMAALLGDKEATYQVAGSQVVNMSGCDPILEMPLDRCDLPDLTTPENGYLYFHFHTCHTPVVSALASSTTHTVKGLSGLQVVGGDSLSPSLDQALVTWPAR